MGMRTRAALLIVAMTAAALTACSDAGNDPAASGTAPTGDSVSSGATSSSASGAPFAASPLRLPRVTAGGTCPVTAAKARPGHPDKVLGTGPLGPIAYYYTGGDAVLQLRADDRQPDGQYRAKVRWIGTGYAGPVLIRADRIDGEGSALAEFSYTGERRDGGFFALLTERDNDIPATTWVSGPGCFAYQVDGTNFTTTIVFDAVLER
ncbi:hypothetical protein [Cryptosporangium sp. NPDC048952]|uniref:hypothetical protein n=1 Tax=Cryptosporangium sp. NPDC048952 TaxID=3363961 RepID=UPI00371E87D7